MITHVPPLLVTIRRRGYVRWWLKHFGHFKKGGTCNIIFVKIHGWMKIFQLPSNGGGVLDCDWIMVTENIWLPFNTPPLFDGDWIFSPFGRQEKGVCDMFLESPWWGLSKNISHTPFYGDQKISVATEGRSKKFQLSQGWQLKILNWHRVGDQNVFFAIGLAIKICFQLPFVIGATQMSMKSFLCLF
jgi:hypothetical protein